jgi:hypothetical protein
MPRMKTKNFKENNVMKCERCNDEIQKGEERELHGRFLCEDCYMDVLSPAKACDPWAVHSAKTFSKVSSQGFELNPTQRKILEVLRDKGPIEPRQVSEMLHIKETDLERELAALRHMEKVRGELRDKKRMIRLW